MNDKIMLFIAFAVIFLAVGCGSSVEISSVRPQEEIVVDGKNDDWEDIPVHVEKTYALAVSNDDDFLYFSLTSQDPKTQMQILRSGLAIWVDREGGSHKSFGVRFPLPRAFNPHPTNGEAGNIPEERRQSFEPESNEMEILGPGKNEVSRLSTLSEKGIQAKIGRVNPWLMVYEMRIPLQEHPQYQYAIHAQSATIGVGIETGPVNRGDMPQRPGGGGTPGGGMSPRGGAGGHPGGMSPGGSRPNIGERPEPIELWMKVNLTQQGDGDPNW